MKKDKIIHDMINDKYHIYHTVIHDMCNGTRVKPWQCIKLIDPSDLLEEAFLKTHPNFFQIEEHGWIVMFAKSIKGDTPIFEDY